MKDINKLKQFGADTDEGLSRCFGNTDFYLKLIDMALADPNFDKLQTSLSNEDYFAAFEAAHALKGVLGNLSLTPMYNLASDMCEQLRPRQKVDCTAQANRLIELKKELETL